MWRSCRHLIRLIDIVVFMHEVILRILPRGLVPDELRPDHQDQIKKVHVEREEIAA